MRAAAILAGQAQDGSFTGNYGPIADTAFALLFLRKANWLPDLAAHLQGEANLRAGGPETKPADPRKPDPLPPVKPPAGGPSEKPTPKPPPNPPIIGANADPYKLGNELVTAAGPRQEEVLRKLTEGKGGEYTQALAEAIPRLSGAAQDRARTALADRLTRMKADTLRQYLKLNDPELRRAAASACARKEAQEHIPDLIPLLSDADPGVSLTAYEALKRLTGKDLGRQPAAWREWWQANGGSR